MKGYIKAIQKKIKSDIKYFARHGIPTDKLDYIAQSLDARTLEAAWKSKELAGLSYEAKVEKIASIAVFPTDLSRKQAEKLTEASKISGQNLSYAQVLRGEFDWEIVAQNKDELIKLYESLGYTEDEAKRKARIEISQVYFGSD